MQWTVGLLVIIALGVAGVAHVAVWTLVGDVKTNAMTGAENRSNIASLEKILTRIETKVDGLSMNRQ